MPGLELEKLSIELIAALFIAAACVVWIAGTRLSRFTDQMADRTGIADVVLGTLLLGGVTSLPEVVTTITASSIGNASIAVNNLFGGVALQVTVLAMGDALLKKQSISSVISSPVIQMQGMVGILLLATSAALIIVGDVNVWHFGIGSFAIFVLFAVSFYFVNYSERIHWWKSDPEMREDLQSLQENVIEKIEEDRKNNPGNDGRSKKTESFKSILKTKLFLYLVISGLAVLLGGFTIVKLGEEISNRTNIGSALVGALFIAIATSLPEISTTVSAVRLKKYRLAFSNIFGTNIFTVGFIFLADGFYMKGPIFNEVDQISLFAAVLGILLTTIYTMGLSLRFRKTFLNLGYDSILVLLMYFSGVIIMITALK